MNIQLLLARSVYLLIGGVAAIVAIGGPLGALANGCGVTWSAAGGGLLDPNGPASCVQYVDPIVTVAGALIAVLTAAAAAWVGRDDPLRGIAARVGIAAGVVASTAPALLVYAIFSWAGEMPGPMEILIGVAPVAVTLAAAVVMWRRRSDVEPSLL